MFSVIIYGRNDSHGYNLHKRAAISFNALAEVMSDPDDEILFVDDIPLGATGKIDKKLIRQRMAGHVLPTARAQAV